MFTFDVTIVTVIPSLANMLCTTHVLSSTDGCCMSAVAQKSNKIPIFVVNVLV